jgi:hypothetical protein
MEASSRAQARIGNSTLLCLFLIAFAAAEFRVDSQFIKTTKMVCCPPRKKQGRTPCQPESFLVIVHLPLSTTNKCQGWRTVSPNPFSIMDLSQF